MSRSGKSRSSSRVWKWLEGKQITVHLLISFIRACVSVCGRLPNVLITNDIREIKWEKHPMAIDGRAISQCHTIRNRLELIVCTMWFNKIYVQPIVVYISHSNNQSSTVNRYPILIYILECIKGKTSQNHLNCRFAAINEWVVAVVGRCFSTPTTINDKYKYIISNSQRALTPRQVGDWCGVMKICLQK